MSNSTLIFTTWKNRDLLLRSWVSGTISEEALYYVGGCNTAKEIWSALEENLLQATKDREIQLKQQMHDMKLGSQTLSEYLKSLKEYLTGWLPFKNRWPTMTKSFTFLEDSERILTPWLHPC